MIPAFVGSFQLMACLAIFREMHGGLRSISHRQQLVWCAYYHLADLLWALIYIKLTLVVAFQTDNIDLFTCTTFLYQISSYTDWP